MPETEIIRILVVDSRGVIASGISTILRGVPGFEVVGQARDGEEALRLSAQGDLDVISMDIDLLGSHARAWSCSAGCAGACRMRGSSS